MQNRVETAWGERNMGGEDLKGTIEHHNDHLYIPWKLVPMMYLETYFQKRYYSWKWTQSYLKVIQVLQIGLCLY